jgi:hypothetical protein
MNFGIGAFIPVFLLFFVCNGGRYFSRHAGAISPAFLGPRKIFVRYATKVTVFPTGMG